MREVDWHKEWTRELLDVGCGEFVHFVCFSFLVLVERRGEGMVGGD